MNQDHPTAPVEALEKLREALEASDLPAVHGAIGRAQRANIFQALGALRDAMMFGGLYGEEKRAELLAVYRETGRI